MNNDDDIDFIETDEEEGDERVSFSHFSYYVLGNVKKQGEALTRVAIANRWLWMTDNSRLREVYPPLEKSLDGFHSVMPGIMDTKRSKTETHEYLKGLKMREDESLKYAYKK